MSLTITLNGEPRSLDAGLSAEFLDESGRPKPAGSVVVNSELAQTLSEVRLGGADGFYKGPAAARPTADGDHTASAFR